MKRRQVIVQGINKKGKSGSIDVLDLDNESFRAYVIDRLICGGLVIPTPPSKIDSSSIKYRERTNNV